MNPQRLPFYQSHIAAMEQLIRRTRLSAHFAGNRLVMKNGTPLIGLTLNKKSFGVVEIAELFMIPNDSVVDTRIVKKLGPDKTPPGLYLLYSNPFVETGHQNAVGAWAMQNGVGVYADGMHIDHMFWNKGLAPKRLNTVGIALMAIAAYKNDFKRITLLAGGGAPPFASQWLLPMIGYFIWPKYGFDAPVWPNEVADANFPELQNCKTVKLFVK